MIICNAKIHDMWVTWWDKTLRRHLIPPYERRDDIYICEGISVMYSVCFRPHRFVLDSCKIIQMNSSAHVFFVIVAVVFHPVFPHTTSGPTSICTLHCLYHHPRPGCRNFLWCKAHGRSRLSSGFQSTFSGSSVCRRQSVLEDGTQTNTCVGGRCLIERDRWSMR